MLIWHYIFFTITIVIGLGSLYVGVYLKREEIFKIPQLERMTEYKRAVLEKEYDQIPVEKLLGKEAYIEVLNEKLEIIYCSRKDIPFTTYTQGEIDCINIYQNTEYVAVDQYKTSDGKEQTMVTIETILENGEVDKEYILLDEDLMVIVSNKIQEKKQYTQRELAYLTGQLTKGYFIYKNEYSNGNIMIMYIPDIKDEDFFRYYNIFKVATSLFVIFYMLMLLLFVYWLNRKVKKPLLLLNTALANFSSNYSEERLTYVGPYEFVEIFESFNTMSKRLNKSEIRKRELEEEKQKMLADISHDLKTPITVIQGYSKAICDGIIQDNQLQKYLMTIYHKSNILTNLINNFYEYSKLEHPEFKLNLEKKDICEYMRSYLVGKYDELSLAGFELEVDIPEKRIHVMIDDLQLMRVFENIIVNAIKHNNPGTKIYVSIKEETKVRITLADNGKGIPQALANSIFNPFVVGDESRNNKQGSGLGLAISKKIINAHGGKIYLVMPPDAPYHTQFIMEFDKT